MGTPEKIRNLEKKLKEASSGDPIRIEKQHNAGKMTARERILTLLDSDSFIELDALVKHRLFFHTCLDYSIALSEQLLDS